MNHLTEEEMILFYYGEQAGASGAHFKACEACREQFRQLQRVLNTASGLPVPDRSASYGEQVWQRLAPQLPTSRFKWWHSWRAWVPAVAMAALVLVAFLVGRYVPATAPTVAAAPVRERILLVAVGDHLEKSQVVLAEIANLEPGAKSKIDLGYEQRAARDLVESGRLFRLTANRTGDAATATVLEDLEQILIDIANGPQSVSDDQLVQLQKRISEAGILFKVRVYADTVEQRKLNPQL